MRSEGRAAREREPSPADLATIEVEWPLIEAEIALVDAQIRVLCACGGPSELDWRRVRRATRRVLTVRAALAGRGRAGVASNDGAAA